MKLIHDINYACVYSTMSKWLQCLKKAVYTKLKQCMFSVSPYTGQRWVKPGEPTLPGFLRQSLWWSLVQDTLLPLPQSERRNERMWIKFKLFFLHTKRSKQCVFTLRTGGLLEEPVEKKMYCFLSYSRLAVLVKRNLADWSPIFLREKNEEWDEPIDLTFSNVKFH